MPKKSARKPTQKPRKRAAAPRKAPKAKPAARKPARASRAPRAPKAAKVPARFRALGGVDPRLLPPGTPYPCSDGYVGAVVRGDKLAGRILACATPPEGKRGQHFVLGKLASGRAISGEFRKGYRDAEKAAKGPLPRARQRMPEAPEPVYQPKLPPPPKVRRPWSVPTGGPRPRPTYGTPKPLPVAQEPAEAPGMILNGEQLPDRIYRVTVAVETGKEYRRLMAVQAHGAIRVDVYGATFPIPEFYQTDHRVAGVGPLLFDRQAYAQTGIMPLMGHDLAMRIMRYLMSLGFTPKMEDVTDEYALVATTAPEDYDHGRAFVVQQRFVPPGYDHTDSSAWRTLIVPREFAQWQVDRNQSGMRPAVLLSFATATDTAPPPPPPEVAQEPYVVTYGIGPSQPSVTAQMHWWPTKDGRPSLTLRVDAWHGSARWGARGGAQWTFDATRNGQPWAESIGLGDFRDLAGDVERWRETIAGVLLALEARYPGTAEAILAEQPAAMLHDLLPDGAYVHVLKLNGRPNEIEVVLGEWKYVTHRYVWPGGRELAWSSITTPVGVDRDSYEMRLEWLWERVATVVFRGVLESHNRGVEHPSDRSHAGPARFGVAAKKPNDRRPIVFVGGAQDGFRERSETLNPDDVPTLAQAFAKRLGLKVKSR